jgi:hypothetical protein
MMVLNYTAQQRANLRANPLAPISIGHLIADCDALTLYANQQEKLVEALLACAPTLNHSLARLANHLRG